MEFVNERMFENYIRDLIKNNILSLDANLVLFESKKAVDILICKNGEKPALYFIEVKYHKLKHGRLSTGHGKGGGFQPEILKLQPDYLSTNMRWILGIEGREGILFLCNNDIKDFLAGGSISIKYNNIKTSIFNKKEMITEEALLEILKTWLL